MCPNCRLCAGSDEAIQPTVRQRAAVVAGAAASTHVGALSCGGLEGCCSREMLRRPLARTITPAGADNSDVDMFACTHPSWAALCQHSPAPSTRSTAVLRLFRGLRKCLWRRPGSNGAAIRLPARRVGAAFAPRRHVGVCGGVIGRTFSPRPFAHRFSAAASLSELAPPRARPRRARRWRGSGPGHLAFPLVGGSGR